MLPSQESLDKINVEVFEKVLQYDSTYLHNLNVFLQKIINNDVEFCSKNQKCQDIFKNIHLQLINIVVFKKHSQDYQSFLPQILYCTLYLSQQNIKGNQNNCTEEETLTLPTKTNETDDGIVHFISLGTKLELPKEKYDHYCLQIHIGAVKCLQIRKQINFIVESIEFISNLCFYHNEVTVLALKHLTECISFLTEEQWKVSSKFIYKVLMGQINHHLPSIHNQCVLLFKKCLDLEDLDYILNIVMTEMSWSLRIKFYMLAAIASKYGVKKILKKYNVLLISMWKCLNEPYLLSPCIGLYKVFIKDLSEDEFLTLVMQPIVNNLLTCHNISELTRYNFVTYLLPEMKHKHVSSLLILYEKINGSLKSDLYLQISVLRMIYNLDDEVENCHGILDLSLKSGDTKIRTEAFILLCCSKVMPEMLNMIYDFIVNNINSDCSTLRIKLISGLENMLRRCKKLDDLVLQFLNRLHAFILKNLTSGSNYQRKIASLRMYSVILKFNKNQDYVSDTCRNFLFINLLDSEDIRKICSEILVSYFFINREDEMYLNRWLKLGLNLCYDPMFYKNESGSLIIYTVITLIYKSKLLLDIINVHNSSMSSYILDLALKQGNRLKADFVNNVTDGTLYGLLDTLNRLSFEQNSPEKNLLNNCDIEAMLNLIEENLNLMLDILAFRMDAERKMEAPSFAQMDDALSCLRKSDQDNIQVPTNQFLLNFIWINIKVCCDVASKYAVFLASSDSLDKQYQNIKIKRCADMIVDVLIRCRHKGAMEATCRSLGILINNWKESQLWCQNVLTDHISCMKPENEISRKSAGVRYLIHAIVTNNKDTVQDCIKQLFNIAKENVCINNDTIIDLPQARAQHLLTAIVSNASISTDSLHHFMEDLIMLCIDKLNSPFWTIRNAAFQFFSSLQVRIIGQNRLNNYSWSSHLPLEPLLYHFPRLMHRLQFLWSQTSYKLPSQAQLIPLMSLLKSVKLQSWTLLPLEHQHFVINLREQLWSIGFALEIYTVRNMAAQAYANTIQPNELSSTLKKIGNTIMKCNEKTNLLKFKNSNHLHGLMSLYQYLKNIYFMEFNQEYQVFNFDHENLPPLCKSMYISMNRDILGPFPTNSTICHINVKQLMIENDIAQSSNLIFLVERYMKDDKHTALHFLKCFKNCNTNNERFLTEKFVDFLDVKDKDIFKEVMMNIDVLVNRRFGSIKVKIEDDYFFEIFKKCVLYSEKDFIAMLPILSWLCPNNAHSTLLPFVCKFIDCDLYDSFDRYSASKSLYYFTDFKNDVRVWNMVVELLQDEDTQVRVEVTRFVNNVCHKHSSKLNPYWCLRKMFEINTVCQIMNTKLAFMCFWNVLSEIKLRIELDETINPFFNEQSNIYQEQSNVIKLAFGGLNSLIHSSENLECYKEIVKNSLNTLKRECDFKGKFVDGDLMILDTYSNVYFLKLYYKRQILITLNFKDHLTMFYPILKLLNLSVPS